ncbi:MAG: hypothetical protein U5N85_07965 [Arcicella sp.]|nr:hypothetical protein [Arcicella sp.]
MPCKIKIIDFGRIGVNQTWQNVTKYANMRGNTPALTLAILKLSLKLTRKLPKWSFISYSKTLFTVLPSSCET